MNRGETDTTTIESGIAWYRRPDFWFWTIAAAGLIFRLEYLREFSQQLHFRFAIGPDVQEYHERALEILNGRLLPDNPEIHGPLYSFFLAAVYKLTGMSIPWARAIQLVINWAAWVGLARVLFRRSGSWKIVLWFTGLAMFTPALIFHQAELISESLLVVLIFGAIYCFDRAGEPRWEFWGGICCGLLVLTHGFMLAFAAAEGAFRLYRRSWKRFFLLSGGVAAVILPVILLKSIHYEKFTGLQANSFFNIYLGSNPDADGGCYLRPGKAWADEHRLAEAGAAERKISVNRLYAERIVRFYLDDPAALLRLSGVKLWKLILPVEAIAGADSPAMLYKTPFQRYLRFLAPAVGLLAIAGIWLLLLKKGDMQFIHFYLLTASLAAAQLLTVTSGRYRVGLMPGVFLLGATAAAALKPRQLAIGAAAAVMMALMLPEVPRIDPEERSIIGEILLRQGRYDEADKALAYASEFLYDPTRFGNMRGIIAEKRSDFAAAEMFYRRAMDEFNPEGHFNLGLMLSRNFPARRREAQQLLLYGIKLQSGRADVWNQIGINGVMLKDMVTAENGFAAAVQLNPDQPGYRKNLEFVRSLIKSPPQLPQNTLQSGQ